jgi:flavin-dependent dehydrogenase
MVSSILHELGVWDKIEAANFPIKVGATYKWGRQSELWDFNFLPVEEFTEEARPATYSGQRTRTAFQVDRAIYDDILLNHCEEAGCEVRQGTRVSEITKEDDKVTGLRLDSGETITADWYCDASGHSGILRRTMGVQEDVPTKLKNIAIYDYWQNADWAVKIGVGGTRIQVISLGFGWIWFIPLGPTRTSVGLVVPAVYYKDCGKKPEELYEWALTQEPRLQGLLKNATSEGKLTTTKDWSFSAERTYGENWFLLGESAGFADPILSAGVTMAHMSGREVAYTIIAATRGDFDKEWLASEFNRRQLTRVKQHIRFADYWYAGNGCFSELLEFTGEIAKDAGLKITPQDSWRWISTGGFVDEDLIAGSSFFSIRAIEAIGSFITDSRARSAVEQYNVFDLDLDGADTFKKAQYHNGTITEKLMYRRNDKLLPKEGAYKILIDILKHERLMPNINAALNRLYAKYGRDPSFAPVIPFMFQALEAMVNDGWVRARFDPTVPVLRAAPKETKIFRLNSDPVRA